MAAQQKPKAGGIGGQAEVSALRKRIAALALPHVETAVQRIVELMDADRESVAMQAATTLLELADTGGEGLGEAAEPGAPTKLTLVVSSKELSEAIAARRKQESET